MIGQIEPNLSHEDLRKAAVKWLTNTKKCSVVLSEMVSAAGEIPDAIGWKGGFSILVECKVSRSDFRRNADKCFIRTGRGMGSKRYFMVPHGMITPEDLKGCEDYGILYVRDAGSSVRLIKDAAHRSEAMRDGEIDMLVSALRRVRTREFLTITQISSGTEVAE